jgi:DNA mismatch repair protein MutL
LDLNKIENALKFIEVKNRWQHDFVSQPLLLPIKITLTATEVHFVESQQLRLEKLGIVVNILNKNSVQIRQFPALLRNKDVNLSFNQLLQSLLIDADKNEEELENNDWQQSFANLLSADSYEHAQTKGLLLACQQQPNFEFEQQLRLNSVVIDLTSTITKLTNTL